MPSQSATPAIAAAFVATSTQTRVRGFGLVPLETRKEILLRISNLDREGLIIDVEVVKTVIKSMVGLGVITGVPRVELCHPETGRLHQSPVLYFMTTKGEVLLTMVQLCALIGLKWSGGK